LHVKLVCDVGLAICLKHLPVLLYVKADARQYHVK